ncbi:hypothetical protein Agub_g13371 [Astrephomene gubernaculifera]|uniref:Uncharacterized protein n=1 Tax=Astrephomene gubernaculifera TaxID=47775 RepID=A0AAD3E216_9CHLO|nr:hypothetical protein Agub_g13371 [Astrephomene gubernaculifera]
MKLAAGCAIVLVVLALALPTRVAAAKRRPPPPDVPFPPSFPPPPPPIQYDDLWALAARGPSDPTGNSTVPGACRRLLGAPRPEALSRKKCKPERQFSWVPTIKEPRYVDVRFEVKATITVGRVGGMKVLLLNKGSLQPVISSIELMVTPKNTTGYMPLLLYKGGADQDLHCPATITFPLELPPASASLGDATVLGARVNVSNGAVDDKTFLPSISAVGLMVARLT